MEHFVMSEAGERVDLMQEGEVAGFRPGDRVAYGGECFGRIHGKNATVIGFSADGRIWSQPDGGTACHWTPAEFAKRDLRKINN